MGAKHTVVVQKQGLRFEWNGYHTVNVYAWSDPDSVAVDCYSIGDFAEESATRERFDESVEQYLAQEKIIGNY